MKTVLYIFNNEIKFMSLYIALFISKFIGTHAKMYDRNYISSQQTETWEKKIIPGTKTMKNNLLFSQFLNRVIVFTHQQ